MSRRAIGIGMTRIQIGIRGDPLVLNAILWMKMLGIGGKRGNEAGAGAKIGAVEIIEKAGVNESEIVPGAGTVVRTVTGQRALGTGIQIGGTMIDQNAREIAMITEIALI